MSKNPNKTLVLISVLQPLKAVFSGHCPIFTATTVRPALILFITLMLPFAGMAQETFRVSNLRLSSFNGTMEFRFDLKGNPAAKTPVHLYFYDNDFRVYRASALVPEQGSLFAGGSNQRLLWEDASKLQKLDKPLVPVIITGNPANFRFGPGPEAALLSLVIPGLGDYVMGNTTGQTIQPWMRTAGAFGLLALGWHASSERYQGEPSFFNENRLWKTGDIHYRFFRNDAELLISAGIAIWVADVIWVSIRGHKNRSLRKNLNTLVIEL